MPCESVQLLHCYFSVSVSSKDVLTAKTVLLNIMCNCRKWSLTRLSVTLF